MQTEIVIATGNAHKLAEIGAKLAELGAPALKLLSLRDYPAYQPPPEDGATFGDNALLKARAVAEMSGKIALADDSGLLVDALNGAPGVHSARYAGPAKDDAANNRKLLDALADVAEAARGARFHCAIAIVHPDGRVRRAAGSVQGRILTAARGAGGFGYDPLFYLPQLGRSMAELSALEKNQISHRALALAEALPLLLELL